jgi:tetratricopeptide (TPR) repeat protein
METGQVFVSHTSDMAAFPPDRSFVQAVLAAVSRAGLAPVDMQYFPAREGQPAEYCRQRVRECEIYVAVVGFCYGSIVPGEAVSFTELEFQEASAAGRRRLVFLLDDSVDPPAGLADADRTAVARFRQRLREAGLVVRSFTTGDGLELEVFHALTSTVRRGGQVAVPRQLPAAVPHFAGRSADLAVLAALARRCARSGSAAVIAAISGTAGVGKTALAVSWADRAAGRFPDGQLYVNLRGFDPAGPPMDPAEAVRGFLDALGVPAQQIPAGLDAQAGLYRSLLAGRRMLVVLDNARDSGQVRPLLPGAPGCLVLVTSRSQLTSLVAADGAQPVPLDLLTPAEARDLLARRLGRRRVAAEPQAVQEIITRCARLPLALAITAARAAAHPAFPLHTLAEELRDSQDRLDELTSACDPAADLHAVFSCSYRILTPAAAQLFRLLGLHPGPDVSAPAAASLAGLSPSRVRPLLAELASASLISEHLPGRYALHDLLCAYAAGQARLIDADGERGEALGRVLDHYLQTAYAADRLLDPTRDPITLAPPRPGVTPERLAGHGQALAWFTAEHPVLMAAVDTAASSGLDTCIVQLAWALWTFLDWQGHWHDQAAVQQAAVAAARRLADPRAEAGARFSLGRACIQPGRLDEARAHLRDALRLYGQTGDRAGQARIHISLAYACEREGRVAEALDHARQALDLYQADGNRRGEAVALNDVGWCHGLLGDHEQALTACERALRLFQELGNRAAEANAWDSLGYAHQHLGHSAQAIACYQHALDLVRERGDRYDQADFLTHLGDTHHAIGAQAAARDAWQQALAILDDLYHPDAAQVRAKLTVLDSPGAVAPG